MEKNRFYILDPLRFVAAYCVLLYHYSIYLYNHETLTQVFKYGYLGVNFFFLLSGFVIMLSAKDRSPFQFVMARILRIYPTFVVCLLVTLLVTVLLAGAQYSWLEVTSNAFILNDYLGIANIDGVYWTLQAELKFYGCVFLLLLMRILPHWRWWVGIWLLLAIMHHFYKQPFFLGWFINPEYSFYFIGGVCAYQLLINKDSLLAKLFFSVALVFAGIKSIEQTHSFLKNVSTHEMVVAFLCNVIFFLFFYFLSLGKFCIRKSKIFMLLGMASYPLYLIHNKAGKSIIDSLQPLSEFALFRMSLLVIAVSLAIVFLVANMNIKKIWLGALDKYHKEV